MAFGEQKNFWKDFQDCFFINLNIRHNSKLVIVQFHGRILSTKVSLRSPKFLEIPGNSSKLDANPTLIIPRSKNHNMGVQGSEVRLRVTEINASIRTLGLGRLEDGVVRTLSNKTKSAKNLRVVVISLLLHHYIC